MHKSLIQKNSIKLESLFSDRAAVEIQEAGRGIQEKAATRGAGPKIPGKDLALAPEADLNETRLFIEDFRYN